jgi:uncharacterized protein related to proFAR isomerase
MRDDFALIPVIDLKDGGVVHARAGKRADYRPLETPFGLADDPVAIARALLAVTDSPILYVADLDAIAGTGHHFDLCRELDTTFPAVTLWIDAGFSNVTDCAFWLPLGATLVIGSESLATLGAWKTSMQVSAGASFSRLTLKARACAVREPCSRTRRSGLTGSSLSTLTAWAREQDRTSTD